jgi:hypothetical protein
MGGVAQLQTWRPYRLLRAARRLHRSASGQSRVIIRVALFFEPSLRLSGDPILGFGLALEPANVLSLAARMPCEHIPFIPQLLSDYRRGRPGHRALSAPAQLRRRRDAPDHVGPKTSANQAGSEASRLAIVIKDIHRQLARESRTDANSLEDARCRISPS